MECREPFLLIQDPDEVSALIQAGSRGWRQRSSHMGPSGLYPDTALNDYHALRHLPGNGFYSRMLAFGGADGQEVLPLLDRVEHVTVVDPGYSRLCEPLVLRGAELRQPAADGRLADPDGAYDLITCFGVLAALPDPPSSFTELVRCLAPGGWLLLSEAIVAMGRERPERPRPGHYWRGMPLPMLDDLVRKGLAVRHWSLGNFGPLRVFGSGRFSSAAIVWLDAFVSRLFGWNVRYRRTHWWHRLRPRTAFYVLQKDAA